jgi:hypothetical protein
MALVNTKSLPNATDRSFTKSFFDAHREYPAEFSRIAKIESRVGKPGRDIKEYEMSGLGDFVDIPEGAAVTFDDPVEGHSKQLLFSKNGLGCQLTEEMQEDDLWGNVGKLSTKLAKSGRMKIDNDYFAMFNGAFSGTTYLSWDGQNICDTDHTTLKSRQTISNDGSSGTGVSLSETGLQGAFEYFDGLIDESGFPLIMEGPYILLAPKQLRWMIAKLAKNEGKVGVFDNDINTVRPGNIAGPQGMPESWTPHISRWLTDADNWFLLARNHDARLVWKRQLKLQSSDDFATGSRLYKATQRYGVGTFDYKGIYGSAP